MREDAVTTQLSNSSRPHPATCPPLIDNPAFLALDIHSLAIDRRRQDLLACSAACAECPKVDTFSSSLEQRDDTGVDGTRSTSLNGDSSSASTADKGRSELARALPPNTVYLHVYDLDPTISKYVNKVMRPLGAGAFHAGVEVYGIEYCYGQTCDNSSGITINRPRKHPVHIYRETIVMGATPFAHEEFLALIEALKDEWPGERYHILTRNCINFANQLCVVLGVGCLPAWLLRLQQQAFHLQKTVQQAARRLQQFDETTGISAVATAAATAAMAAARVFGGLLQPQLSSSGGEAASVGSRIDRALTSGISLLSGGLGAFADGVAEGLAGILDDEEEEQGKSEDEAEQQQTGHGTNHPERKSSPSLPSSSSFVSSSSSSFSLSSSSPSFSSPPCEAVEPKEEEKADLQTCTVTLAVKHSHAEQQTRPREGENFSSSSSSLLSSARDSTPLTDSTPQ